MAFVEELCKPEFEDPHITSELVRGTRRTGEREQHLGMPI